MKQRNGKSLFVTLIEQGEREAVERAKTNVEKDIENIQRDIKNSDTFTSRGRLMLQARKAGLARLKRDLKEINTALGIKNTAVKQRTIKNAWKNYLVVVHPRNSQSSESSKDMSISAPNKARAIAQAKAQMKAFGLNARNYTFQVFEKNPTRRAATNPRTVMNSKAARNRENLAHFIALMEGGTPDVYYGNWTKEQQENLIRERLPNLGEYMRSFLKGRYAAIFNYYDKQTRRANTRTRKTATVNPRQVGITKAKARKLWNLQKGRTKAEWLRIAKEQDFSQGASLMQEMFFEGRTFEEYWKTYAAYLKSLAREYRKYPATKRLLNAKRNTTRTSKNATSKTSYHVFLYDKAVPYNFTNKREALELIKTVGKDYPNVVLQRQDVKGRDVAYQFEYFSHGKKVTRKRANSSIFNRDKISELSEAFQGHVNGQQIKSSGSDFTPNLVARAGKLSLMKIRNGRDVYELAFEGKDAWLGFDARKNMHVVGKDTRVKNVKNLPPKNRLHLLGDLEQINYITAKSHIENGDLVEYYHRLGEIDGIKPNVWIDHEGFLLINSGNYDVLPEGIAN